MFFAGKVTHVNTTTPGSYLTGIREAQRAHSVSTQRGSQQRKAHLHFFFPGICQSAHSKWSMTLQLSLQLLKGP